MEVFYQIYTDGASRGNPGPAGAGGVITTLGGQVVSEVTSYLGIQTNNVAEYQALRLTLERAIELNLKHVEVFMDSKLVVEQLNGMWQIKALNLKIIYDEIKQLISKFESITFTHIYRKFNKHADRLANDAIDKLNFKL